VRSEKKSISIVKTLKRNNRTATPKIIEIIFYTIIRFFKCFNCRQFSKFEMTCSKESN